MKGDFRSRYQKGGKGRLINQQLGQSSPDDIISDLYDDDDSVSDYSSSRPLFRLMAFLFDAYIIFSLIFFITYLIDGVSKESLFSITGAKAQLASMRSAEGYDIKIILGWCSLIFTISFFYYCFFEACKLRATPGKILMGLYITDKDGGDVSAKNAIFRNVFKVFSLIPFGFGFFMVLFGKKQTLHDLLSKTRVSQKADLSINRRIVRFLGLSFTSGFFLVTCLILGLLHLKKDVQTIDENKKEENVIEEATPIPTPTMKPRGQSGSIVIGDSNYQINGVFLRKTPPQLDDRLSSDIFGTDNYSNSTVIEAFFFEDSLSADEIKKLQTIYDILSESESIIGRKAVARLKIAYDYEVTYCHNNNVIYANLDLNDVVSAGLSEKTIELYKDHRSVDNSSSFITSCDALNYGKEISLKLLGKRKTVKWNINAKAIYLRYKLLGSSSYINSTGGVAVFNEKTNTMEIGFFDRKLTKNELDIIRSYKGVNAPKLSISPRAIGTVKLTITTNLNTVRNAAISLKQKNKYITLSADNVLNGYTIWFRRDGTKINFPGESNELLIRYSSPQIPSTFSGMLENDRYVVGRFAGEKRVKLKEGIFKFNWSMSYNTKLIYVK